MRKSRNMPNQVRGDPSDCAGSAGEVASRSATLSSCSTSNVRSDVSGAGNRALDRPQRVGRLIETIFFAVGRQFPQEHRWQRFAFRDRNNHAQQILPMRLDQLPINDLIPEEGLNMRVVRGAGWTVEGQVFPITYSRHQLNTQERCQAKYWQILALGIGMIRCRFD